MSMLNWKCFGLPETLCMLYLIVFIVLRYFLGLWKNSISDTFHDINKKIITKIEVHKA